jgi:pyruvate formate lyase activating enzyme
MAVQCELCPKYCLIEKGQSGECRIRVNLDDTLLAVTYGHPCALHLDPVEKKPLFHFLPGSGILSLATAGCNLHCKNCQNWEISQANPENVQAYSLTPSTLVENALEKKIPSIAYTYTDPFAYYEYTLETAKLAREKGLKNVLVTAGYLNEKPLKNLLPSIDAANIDLKAMSDRFYRDVCGGTLSPVLNTLVLTREAGILLEVTNLLIPTLNDRDRQIRELTDWIVRNLGVDTPLHFSRFYPQYRMKNLPPTSAETLNRARQIALDTGLRYVYIGNILTNEGENTYCPSCKKMLVRRERYRILENRIQEGRCADCGERIHGTWI